MKFYFRYHYWVTGLIQKMRCNLNPSLSYASSIEPFALADV
ncbi:hypothetical protein HanXRQr2_Chr14g0627371 [Helianthus annuus]|uniref:Uncharacterized protein n=1 Tax=Helianthus annuus TaxID=4232 RepID=A0A9K3E642_HELAN|nr:hypothetical protein HanXRQr2_Chr14g0627371 [Helianthus annuus]